MERQHHSQHAHLISSRLQELVRRKNTDSDGESPPGTLTTLNAKLQRTTLSLDPLKQTTWLEYRPIDTPGTEMYHPSNELPRTANTRGYFAVHEKQEANKVVTASQGELPRLPSREGRKKQKTQSEENTEGDKTLGYLGVVNTVTPEEDVPLRGRMV
ncbi:hypothetical protein AVEN_196634-1 [Araneus ventricosus]|uniref:Uncharacterized protein n=1 Tax=Araneus ventricosus TaxID=182803 RepID=A0A4Y2E318_ARAVE|nr:hypothetical protein AVEN_196634-1 [Araneus ventricosus]